MEQVLSRKTEPIKMRNYGRIIQDMITYACTIQNQAERESLVVYIAQCMRQKNQVWNRDQESGTARIIEDISNLSDHQLSCDFEGFEQMYRQSSGQQSPMQNRNKKRKNL